MQSIWRLLTVQLEVIYSSQCNTLKWNNLFKLSSNWCHWPTHTIHIIAILRLCVMNFRGGCCDHSRIKAQLSLMKPCKEVRARYHLCTCSGFKWWIGSTRVGKLNDDFLLQFNSVRAISSHYDHGKHPGLILLSHDFLPVRTKIVCILSFGCFVLALFVFFLFLSELVKQWGGTSICCLNNVLTNPEPKCQVETE